MIDRPDIFWIKWGGVPEVCDFYNIPQNLPYPISFNLPEVSWKFGDEITISPKTTSYNFFVDIVYEVKPNVKENYFVLRFCIGLMDNRFLAEHSETVRDEAVSKYYGRFIESYNVLSDKTILFNACEKDFGKNYEIFINNESYGSMKDISLGKDFEFIQSFSSLREGDLISLGSIFALWNLKPDSIGSVEIKGYDFNWKVVFKKDC